MTYIGIDPGKSGALAVIEEGIAFAIPFDKRAYKDTLATCDPNQTVICLEHVGPMPGQGVVSMFHFGENFGWLQGVLDTFGIPYELVRPKKWKLEFSVTSDKNTAAEACRRLFPNAEMKRTDRRKKEHDGMCEALLMAEYARRKFGRD